MKKQQLGFGLESLKDGKFAPLSNTAMQNVTGGEIKRSGAGRAGTTTYDHDMLTTYANGTADWEFMNKDGSIAAPGKCGEALSTK